MNFEFDIKSGRNQGILIYSLPNKHSTYDYGSLLKIVRKKDRKNLIEHPIFFFSFIFILLLIAFIYFLNTTCIKPSQKTERSLRSVSPELHSGTENSLWFPSIFVRLHSDFYNKTIWWNGRKSAKLPDFCLDFLTPIHFTLKS